MPTLAEIRNRVIRNLNRQDLFSSTPDPSQLDTQIIDDAINDTIKEVLTENNFRIAEESQTIPLIQDIVLYALPTDFHRSESMFLADTNGVVIQKVQYTDRDTFESLTANDESLFFNPVYLGAVSTPLVFTIEGANIKIKPITVVATNALLHKYFKFLPDLVNDVDTNYFTTSYPRLLELGATSYLLDINIQLRGDSTAIQDARSRYEREKNRVILSESLSKGTETIAISNRV